MKETKQGSGRAGSGKSDTWNRLLQDSVQFRWLMETRNPAVLVDAVNDASTFTDVDAKWRVYTAVAGNPHLPADVQVRLWRELARVEPEGCGTLNQWEVMSVAAEPINVHFSPFASRESSPVETRFEMLKTLNQPDADGKGFPERVAAVGLYHPQAWWTVAALLLTRPTAAQQRVNPQLSQMVEMFPNTHIGLLQIVAATCSEDRKTTITWLINHPNVYVQAALRLNPFVFPEETWNETLEESAESAGEDGQVELEEDSAEQLFDRIPELDVNLSVDHATQIWQWLVSRADNAFWEAKTSPSVEGMFLFDAEDYLDRAFNLAQELVVHSDCPEKVLVWCGAISPTYPMPANPPLFGDAAVDDEKWRRITLQVLGLTHWATPHAGFVEGVLQAETTSFVVVNLVAAGTEDPQVKRWIVKQTVPGVESRFSPVEKVWLLRSLTLNPSLTPAEADAVFTAAARVAGALPSPSASWGVLDAWRDLRTVVDVTVPVDVYATVTTRLSNEERLANPSDSLLIEVEATFLSVDELAESGMLDGYTYGFREAAPQQGCTSGEAGELHADFDGGGDSFDVEDSGCGY